MTIPDGLQSIVQAQDGLLTRRQARDHGLTASAIRHALGPQGSWQRVVPGVYATFTGSLHERHKVRAALLYAGPEAVVTGSYACRGYGMEYVPASGLELLVPWHVQRAPISIATIRRVRSMPAARTLRGVPCASPERAALDAARNAYNLRDVRAVLCEVVQRRLTTAERLVHESANVDHRGFELGRQALGDVQAGCRSAPECELRDLIATSAVVPEPRWNQPLPGAPELCPDACIEQARLVIEVDSLEWHGYGDAPELTERRRARYASLGWRVLPVSPRRLREEPDAVLAEIEAAVTEGLSRAA